MTGMRYGLGLLCVVVAAILVGVILPGSAQDGWWPALVIALVVQAPLGWWVVRSVGRPSFLWAWGAGLLTRFGLVGVAAFLLVPRLGWPPAATLLSLVTLLLAILALETVVVVLEQSHAEK